jgi:MerR family transcriptional regulator, heat shock protein HspR
VTLSRGVLSRMQRRNEAGLRRDSGARNSPGATEPGPDMLKIGDVAHRIGVSVQAIRLYEAEGLLIPYRSSGGTRWYSREDLAWIATIRRLLCEGLNFEGIRRLLAQIPCWALKPCRPEEHAACEMRRNPRTPCWSAPDRLCPEELRDCYHCNTYRRAGEFVNLKSTAQIVPLRID